MHAASGIKQIGLAILAAPLLIGAAAPARDTLILGAHNRERASIDLPAMHWDAALTVEAQKWADHMAATGQFEHYEEVSTDPDAQGENLWMGTKGAFGVETMVSHWIEEKKDFVPGVFPQNSRTGDMEDVGHYTQIVWRATGRVGCAIAEDGEDEFLVCRYAEGGNVIGERPF
ncbi:CAP domain-containing protein [Sphingobium boeckii]|uniref:SCP domain-containing protein n=1 Tax=Sphingobium boeckii TaxID=1082345 RepID=A0A7W9AGW1_9SPHN|nr:CAP domain-containing protein [Sphingobium boeckii]MBB5685424.1 hypothetical protein [Sphingobium boeckii]